MREPKKVPLEVGERFVVMQLLPEKANFRNMKLIRELKEALVLTSEEEKAVKLIQHDDGRIEWKGDLAKETIAEIGFDPTMMALVIAALEKLEKAEEIEQKHVSVYEKFVVCEKDAKGGPKEVVKDK